MEYVLALVAVIALSVTGYNLGCMDSRKRYVPVAVSSAEYERAKMMVVMGAMQLWASGKLDLVEVDPS